MPLRQKVPLHTMIPFREEGTRPINHTRRILHVRVHCSSSSSHRTVKPGSDDDVGQGQKQVTEEGLNHEELPGDEDDDYDYYGDL